MFHSWGNSGDARSNAKAKSAEQAKLFDCRVYLPGIRPPRIEHGLGIFEDYKRFPLTETIEVASDPRGSQLEEVSERGRKLVTPNKSVITKPLFDAMVMEDGQSDGRLADSTGTN